MFVLKDFIVNTINGMVGNEPHYKVREYALGWYSKSILTEQDLADLDQAIEDYDAQKEAEALVPVEPLPEPEITQPEAIDPEMEVEPIPEPEPPMEPESPAEEPIQGGEAV